MSLRSLLRGLGTGLYHLSTLGMEKEHSFSRHGMYQSIRRALASNHLQLGGPVLSISHSTHLLPILEASATEVTEANFPEVNILNLPHADNRFDLLVSDQVFEHIQGLPSDAMAESLRVLKPGGWMLHTTCFFTPYHGPGDYWRWTAEGLAELARHCGASQVISGGAGHPAEMIYGLLGWRWFAVPKARWHPLRWLASLDRPSYWNTVWVLARK